MANLDGIWRFIGKPWVYGVNDCWSVFCEASEVIFGVTIDPIKIPSDPDLAATIGVFEAGAASDKWRRVDVPEPGAAVLFRNPRGHAVHIGIFIEAGSVLHCRGSVGAGGATTYDRLTDILKQTELKTCEFYVYDK